MVHGQEHRCRFKPFMEQYCYWKVIQHFCLTKVLVWLVLGFCAMSRCFPFPWPGYERKARVDDLDLLKKEKQREKKQKKEKKDKREKDKSDGKHKEKKDKRKDKEKTGNLDEKRLPVISDGHIGEKVSNNKRFPGQPEGLNGKKVSNEKRFPGFEDQNGERVSNERRLPMQSEGHGVEKIIPDEKDKHRNNLSNERNSAGKAAGHNGEVIRSIPLAEETRDSKFDQGFDGRVKEEEEAKGAGNDNASKFTGAGQKRDGGMARRRIREIMVKQLTDKDSGMKQYLVRILWFKILLKWFNLEWKEWEDCWRRRKRREVMINRGINIRTLTWRKKGK